MPRLVQHEATDAWISSYRNELLPALPALVHRQAGFLTTYRARRTLRQPPLLKAMRHPGDNFKMRQMRGTPAYAPVRNKCTECVKLMDASLAPSYLPRLLRGIRNPLIASIRAGNSVWPVPLSLRDNRTKGVPHDQPKLRQQSRPRQ